MIIEVNLAFSSRLECIPECQGLLVVNNTGVTLLLKNAAALILATVLYKATT